jgi:hypothetical protein
MWLDWWTYREYAPNYIHQDKLGPKVFEGCKCQYQAYVSPQLLKYQNALKDSLFLYYLSSSFSCYFTTFRYSKYMPLNDA